MNIIVGRPPNFDDIAAILPAARGKNVYFTFGDTIFNPGGVCLTPSVLAHEHVHSQQQRRFGTPNAWWGHYLADATFRFQEELEAHAVEFLTATRGGGRTDRRRYLAAVAERLSSPLYGKLMSKSKAADHIAAMVEFLNQPAGRQDHALSI